MAKWLSIIGVGEDGESGLGQDARTALMAAKVIIGSKRLLNFFESYPAKKVEWPQPFSRVATEIQNHKTEATVILATGDPLFFGAARKILELVPFSETTIIPHLSAFSLAAARTGWSIPDCDLITLHGRAAAHIEPFIQPAAKLFVLTADENAPAEIAARFVKRGFAHSKITVLENMGGPNEKISTTKASALKDNAYSPLNMLAIECIAEPQAKVYTRLAGLPDDAFLHDGQLTKRAVRAATLAQLAPAPDEILWDIGAGCGSVSIEWMRSTRGTMAYAIEEKPERQAMIIENADALGTPRLKLITGKAPEALAELPAPHAIFIGGGINDSGVFEAAWPALKQGGRLVANCVTLEGQEKLIALQKNYGGELMRLDIATQTSVGPYRSLRPAMSVLQWAVTKGFSHA